MIKIQAARQLLGLSQSEMAALLEVNLKTLQGWEQGRPMPDRMQKPIRLAIYFHARGELDVYRSI